jgi:hypothetical protein
MGYPLMLYRGGVNLEDYVIVPDEAAEKDALADGYERINYAAVKGLEPAKPAEPVKRGPGRPKKVQA